MVNQRNAFMMRLNDSLNVFMRKGRNWEANAFDKKKWQASMQKEIDFETIRNFKSKQHMDGLKRTSRR